MDQLDRTTAENVLREANAAGIDLDRLAAEIGLAYSTFVRRIDQGSFKVRELGLIANLLGCSTAQLLASDKGAVA